MMANYTGIACKNRNAFQSAPFLLNVGIVFPLLAVGVARHIPPTIKLNNIDLVGRVVIDS